mmetsp:Transcript_19826/g.25528  ORF Transcript_19826/g.25528 Transcript_19826/m.25528 type:complete len:316 (+) Transcript_19826:104-1051(+)
MLPKIIPVSPYGTLTGELFLYSGGRVAFESPSASTGISHLTTKKCILLGGLSDGLMPVPYTEKLEQCCTENGFSLVQPILSSSYTGFGHGSLDRDCEEIQQLMDYLEVHRSPEGSECQFCLVGHSTGCQDIVHFLKRAPFKYRAKVHGFALQAPVSDREHAEMEEGYAQNLALAQQMRENKKIDECMPRSAFWAPITARRFLDLQERGGTDDYFSSSYSDDELQQRIGHCVIDKAGDGTCQRHGLIAYSAAEEYVPEHVDCKLLSDRLAQAMNFAVEEGPRARSICIPSANHNLSKPTSGASTFAIELSDLLKDM